MAKFIDRIKAWCSGRIYLLLMILWSSASVGILILYLSSWPDVTINSLTYVLIICLLIIYPLGQLAIKEVTPEPPPKRPSVISAPPGYYKLIDSVIIPIKHDVKIISWCEVVAVMLVSVDGLEDPTADPIQVTRSKAYFNNQEYDKFIVTPSRHKHPISENKVVQDMLHNHLFEPLYIVAMVIAKGKILQ